MQSTQPLSMQIFSPLFPLPEGTQQKQWGNSRRSCVLQRGWIPPLLLSHAVCPGNLGRALVSSQLGLNDESLIFWMPDADHLWLRLERCCVLTSVTEVNFRCDCKVKTVITTPDTQKRNPRTIITIKPKLIANIWD